MKSIGASFNRQNFAMVASVENTAVVGIPHEVLCTLTALVEAQLGVIFEIKSVKNNKYFWV
jgi:hypothetical protein